MTQHSSILKKNPYFSGYQVFAHEILTKQETSFYFQLYPLHLKQQVVIFSKKSADTFRSTPPEVQEMAAIVLKELLLYPEDIIWIEKCFSSFDKSQPVFNRIVFEWKDGQLDNPKWVSITEDWNLVWLENLTPKTVVLNKN